MRDPGRELILIGLAGRPPFERQHRSWVASPSPASLILFNLYFSTVNTTDPIGLITGELVPVAPFCTVLTSPVPAYT